MSEINIASYVISPFNNPLYAYRLLRTHDLPFHLTPSRTSDLSYGRNQEPSVPYLSQSSSASFSRKSFVSSTVPLYRKLRLIPYHEGQTLIQSSQKLEGANHPLLRGADICNASTIILRHDLSPPARGRRNAVQVLNGLVRFIPSCDGQTDGLTFQGWNYTIYPLLRGADTQCLCGFQPP